MGSWQKLGPCWVKEFDSETLGLVRETLAGGKWLWCVYRGRGPELQPLNSIATVAEAMRLADTEIAAYLQGGAS